MRRLVPLLVVLLLLLIAGIASASTPNETGLRSDFANGGVWVNDSAYGIPLYQPCVSHLWHPDWGPCSDHARINVQHVNRDHDTGTTQDNHRDDAWRDPTLTEAWEGVYVAPGFKPSTGSDHTAIIRSYTANSADLTEFWEMRTAYHYTDGSESACDWVWDWGGYCSASPTPGKTVTEKGWLASWGGSANLADMNHPDGLNVWPNCPGNCRGISASGISYYGDMITLKDVQTGTIDHPLAFAVPNACTTHKAPATRDDGMGGNPCVQYGAKFKLDPNVNVDAIRSDSRWCQGSGESGEGSTCPLPPLAKMILKAAQGPSYIVATDQSWWGNPVSFGMESWDRPRTDNWTNVPAGSPYGPTMGCDGLVESGHWNSRPLNPGEGESDCYPSLQASFKGFPWGSFYEVP